MKPALICLAAGDATATISPAEGGMLLSLQAAGQELLVAPPRTAASGPVPRHGSFLMAPWVGELSMGQLEYRGRHATIPANHGRHAIHGLVATAEWQVEELGPTSTRLLRRLDPPWPFGGVVVQDITLDAVGITLEAEVRATEMAMPAAVGWHPWFACADPRRVRVQVDAACELELDDELLPTGVVRPVTAETDLRQGPILGERDIDVVFVGATSPATLELPNLTLEIQFDSAIDNVVVFTSPGAVCIEPWSAWPDAYRASTAGHPSRVQMLEPGQSLRRWTRWAWTTGRRRGNGPDGDLPPGDGQHPARGQQ
jgi:aldose 1-epimerase